MDLAFPGNYSTSKFENNARVRAEVVYTTQSVSACINGNMRKRGRDIMDLMLICRFGEHGGVEQGYS